MDPSLEQDAALAHVVAHGGCVWVSGPPGAGKTELLERALGARPPLRIRGRRLRSRGLAALSLAHLTHRTPPASDFESISRWMEEGARGLLREHATIVVEELDLANRELGGLLVDELHRQRGHNALLIESRSPPWTALSRRGDVQHVELVDAQAGAAAPPAWAELDRPARRALMLLLLCDDSPLGEDLGHALVSPSPKCDLMRVGLVDPAGRVPRHVREAYLPQLEADPAAPGAERALARQLLERDTAGPVELELAAQLLSTSPDKGLIQQLARRWHSDQRGPEVLQAQLDRLALVGRMPARARLLSYRANAEGYHGSLQRDLHDALVASNDPDTRLLAHSALVRAGVWSGLRELPAEVFDSLEHTQQAGVADELRQQMALLWAAGSVVRGPDAVQGPLEVVALLRRSGLPDAVCQEFAAALDASRLAFQLQVDEALEILARAAQRMRELGYHPTAHSADRLRLVLMFLDNRTAELRPLVDEVAASTDSERREYADLFRALLEWQDGSTHRLQRHCRGLPERPPTDDHPLLPRPHFRDYLPCAFRALRDRALDQPPDLELVPIFVEAMGRLRFFFATVLGAVALAQHCLLWDELDAGRQLATALAAAPGGALQGSILLGCCDHLTQLDDVQPVVRSLELAMLLPDPATTPYYVMLATRAAMRHGLDRAELVQQLDRLLAGWSCSGQPEAIVAACRRALEPGVEGDASRSREPIEHWVDQRLAGAGAVHDRGATPEDVRALQACIEARFRGSFKLADYAGARSQSADVLARRFTRVLGRSPKQYQVELRIAQATRLILETDWELTRVALECGFYDAPQLARAFRKRKGLSPQEFRSRFA